MTARFESRDIGHSNILVYCGFFMNNPGTAVLPQDSVRRHISHVHLQAFARRSRAHTADNRTPSCTAIDDDDDHPAAETKRGNREMTVSFADGCRADGDMSSEGSGSLESSSDEDDNDLEHAPNMYGCEHSDGGGVDVKVTVAEAEQPAAFTTTVCINDDEQSGESKRVESAVEALGAGGGGEAVEPVRRCGVCAQMRVALRRMVDSKWFGGGVMLLIIGNVR